ncbi:MAG: transcription-repair coupling factor [Gammaproteobacteria bacterium]|nr:transcription-repair coupling factor [Gammaproteobacteria bacterium]
MVDEVTLFNPVYDATPKHHTDWGQLYGCSYGLVIKEVSEKHDGPLIVITADTTSAARLEYELRFFLGHQSSHSYLTFPDWETLPYDNFSPHQDIVSNRLATLYRLPELTNGILIVPITTLMTRLAPRSFLDSNSLMLDVGQTLDIEQMRTRLEAAGYQCVSTVYEHGEFAVRGNILDLFPMGNNLPYRIDLFDNEIETMRTFSPEDQRSIDKVEQIRLLPAREFPLNKESITYFRDNFRATFEGNPQNSLIYRDISNGIAPAGIEYYMPLFFEKTQTLFDYLPDNSLLISLDESNQSADEFWQNINDRYEQLRHNIDRPILKPGDVFLQANEVIGQINKFPLVRLQRFKTKEATNSINFATEKPPSVTLDIHAAHPTDRVKQFVDTFITENKGRILFAAETPGRRETLLEFLHGCDLFPTPYNGWPDFINDDSPLGITVAPLDNGLLITEPHIAVIAEPQLFGEQVMQRRRRKKSQRDTDNVIRNLAELNPGSPVVHEDHGVGRFLNLQTIHSGNIEAEYLTLEYADGDKLYVPVSSLQLISRYSGSSPENAPLHKLGSGHWEKAKRKASEKVRDVAAELLEIYARREARKGFAYTVDDQYASFSATFPFEETPDQEETIANVISDMKSEKPMDRLVCGDVGFGKTEVAMRAAFIAVQEDRQVAILVPTTLLAQQHYQSFKDRFADWPIQIESLSRFGTKKAQDKVIAGLAKGTVDIVIGTHKLLQASIKYANLGLLIIDEEHRFGVTQKEKFKSLRSEVDVLTLTATPIPRTLNMSLSGMRDLSIIATPPARRLAIKTFISHWNDVLIKEACQRELKRGGQVYFLHNKVDTIEKISRDIEKLVPEATVRFAHGQMREHELERAMLDFYHQRFNILVCTTIIETGIDVPNANTIIMNRADRFGLAQLYQLRGRVGRSHHQAYAYLITPAKKLMTPDAVKRLEAIESIHDLGTGFTLATHDLEIRGAGELLGDEQSGHMQEIGFSLYSELLERAVSALKAGREPELDRPLDHGTEVDLSIPALIPEGYLADVHGRLIMYKRIAGAANHEELKEIQVEMIDRFGLLPDATKNLFRITELKLKSTPLGIRKIEVATGGGRFIFNEQPNFDPMVIIEMVQKEPGIYKLDGNNKLRIIKELADNEMRFKMVDQLLNHFLNH